MQHYPAIRCLFNLTQWRRGQPYLSGFWQPSWIFCLPWHLNRKTSNFSISDLTTPHWVLNPQQLLIEKQGNRHFGLSGSSTEERKRDSPCCSWNKSTLCQFENSCLSQNAQNILKLYPKVHCGVCACKIILKMTTFSCCLDHKPRFAPSKEVGTLRYWSAGARAIWADEIGAIKPSIRLLKNTHRAGGCCPYAGLPAIKVGVLILFLLPEIW